MKTITYIIVGAVLFFIINIIFYYSSDNYRFFLKKLKAPNEVIYVEEKVVSDVLTPPPLEEASIIKVQKDIEKIEKNLETKKQVVLGQAYRKILEKFREKYSLSELELETNLFDITNEYPDPYYEYYSPGLTLYFFPTKDYTEVKDIFDVLSYELPFSLNEVNNFGDNSFYINLTELVSDNFVRIVINHKSITFGLKIKKDQYNNVKQILKELKGSQ